MVSSSRIRLSDVAAAANVSVPTASMALANHPNISAQTRRKIMALSRRLGYRHRSVSRDIEVPAKAIRRLGCVCLGDSFDRPVIALLFSHLTAGCSRMQVRLDAACIEDLSGDQKIAAELRQFTEPLDGVVMLGSVGAAALSSVAAAHVPCVAVGDQAAEHIPPGLDVVTYDHERAGVVATTHLLHRGHRRIAFLTDTLRPGGANPRWLDGYRLAHLNAGVPIDPQLVAMTNVLDGGSPPFIERLVALEQPPTAWVAVNTFQATELLITLKALGRPDEVCGHYNDNPPQVAGLSALLFPIKPLCDAALARLVQLCKTPGEPPLRIIVPFQTHNIESN